MTEETRICRKHGGEPLPLSAFPKNKNAPGGIDKMCKQCWKDRPKKSFNGKSPDRVKAKPAEKVDDSHLEKFKYEETLIGSPSRLSKDRKYFEWTGDIQQGLRKYKELYKVNPPKEVYTFVMASGLQKHWA